MKSLFLLGPARLSIVLASAAATVFAVTTANATVTATLADQHLSAEHGPGTYAWAPPTGPQFSWRESGVGNSSGDGDGVGASADALSNLSPTEIEFRNGIAATGVGTRLSLKTGVNVTFLNDEHQGSLVPVLRSTLLAAGMGTYFAEIYGGGCTTADITHCGTGDPGIDAATGGAINAGFKFDVSVNGQSIYSLSGEVGATADHQYYQTYTGPDGVTHDDFTGIDRYLNGFTSDTDSDGRFQTFGWDDSAVDITLPGLLNEGQSVTALYTITTYTTVDSDTFGNSDVSYTPLAYASFGDPVGRAGVTGNALLLNSFAQTMSDATFDDVNGLNERAVGHFHLPTGYVDPLTHQYVAEMIGHTYQDDDAGAGGVPEPASWAMMLGGFGMLGATMRRRRIAFA